ncbi:hypothetical protein [Nocardiopsis lucentensis]|uniref:hypothetical protein n=1 Tax=Nocardiopsis lucentensis TaxID=53441 RepID=UPI000348C553|nr:hypothetical protein [Nocardiopsis lucentensis]
MRPEPQHRLPQVRPSPSTTLKERLRRGLASYPHLFIWFGESTLSYWVAGPAGLAEASGPDSLTRILERVPTRL